MVKPQKMTSPATQVSEQVLQGLVPLDALTPARLKELGEVCFAEPVARGVDAFRVRGPHGQAVYVLAGELELTLADGSNPRISAGTEAASHPLGRRGAALKAARAVVDSEIVRID